MVTELALSSVQDRLRGAYEAGRRQRALWLASPFAVVGLAGLLAGPRPLVAVAVGLAVCGLAFACFVAGRQLELAVLPGTVAGFIPFGLAQLTRLWGHACLGGHCVSLCLPACTAGGVLAGLMVTVIGRRRGAGPTFYLAAGAFSALTGALGCSCIGYTGVIGLVVGLVASSAAGALVGLVRGKAT